MPAAPPYLGEFEQLILLAILQLGPDAYGVGLGRELEASAGRRVARGALYTTLDRLEDKRLVRWKFEPGGDDRARVPRKIYALTPLGLSAIRASQHALRRMSRGLDRILNRTE